MKKISTIIGFFLAGFLLWYLIIKPYDYLVTFKVKTTVGTINQSIKLWNTSLENSSPILLPIILILLESPLRM